MTKTIIITLTGLMLAVSAHATEEQSEKKGVSIGADELACFEVNSGNLSVTISVPPPGEQSGQQPSPELSVEVESQLGQRCGLLLAVVDGSGRFHRFSTRLCQLGRRLLIVSSDDGSAQVSPSPPGQQVCVRRASSLEAAEVGGGVESSVFQIAIKTASGPDGGNTVENMTIAMPVAATVPEAQGKVAPQ